jgi:hypothetical protein
VAGRLCWGDISRQSWGLQLTVPFGKTCPQPTDIALVRRDDWFCPVWALNHLLSFGSRHLTATTSLYPKSYSAFTSEFKKRCRAAGIAKDVTTHTIRRSGTTFLFDP